MVALSQRQNGQNLSSFHFAKLGQCIYFTSGHDFVDMVNSVVHFRVEMCSYVQGSQSKT